MSYKSEAAEAFSKLMDDLGELSSTGVVIFDLATEMMPRTIDNAICGNTGEYWEIAASGSIPHLKGPKTTEIFQYKIFVKNGLVLMYYSFATVTHAWKYKAAEIASKKIF